MGGKVITILYCRQVKDQADVNRTLADNDNFIKNLSLKAAESQRSVAGLKTATGAVMQLMPLLLTIVVGAALIMGLVVGVLFLLQKRNKSK